MDTETKQRKEKKWTRRVARPFTLSDNEKGKRKKKLSRVPSRTIPISRSPADTESPASGAFNYASSNSSSSSSIPVHDGRMLVLHGTRQEEFRSNESVELGVADEVAGVEEPGLMVHHCEKQSYHRSLLEDEAFKDDIKLRGWKTEMLRRRHALKNLSRSTPAMSPSASPRHSDSEGPPRISKGTKKFMRHFADAPASEWVLNYFSCALVSDILLQGTLFITPNYFAFYSKIFGHVSKLMIPVTQVATIQKERTAKIIPNAVGLHMLDGKSYVFGSLLSRDSTYKLMLHIWKKAQRIADSDSEPPLSAVPVVSVYERW
nr:uncharacterized protein LOC128686676 isoform X2 [Cherax quadricarinatus]